MKKDKDKTGGNYWIILSFNCSFRDVESLLSVSISRVWIHPRYLASPLTPAQLSKLVNVDFISLFNLLSIALFFISSPETVNIRTAGMGMFLTLFLDTQ